MSLSLVLPTLRSRTKNAEITAKRVAAKVGSKVLGKLAQFAGWAWQGLVKFFSLSFDRLWDMFVDAYFNIKHFDWNQTDKALEAQITANNRRLATVAAEALGEQLGFGLVRVVNGFIGKISKGKKGNPATGMKIPVLSSRIGLALAEEGREEAVAGLRTVLNATISSQVSNQFIQFVQTARRNEWFGQKKITEPMANGSLAEKIEKTIEKAPEFWRQPIEEFIEGFEEGIITAGYVVASTIDDAVAANRYTQLHGGKEKAVEITLEKGSDEKILIKGGQAQVMDIMRSTLYAEFPIMKNRDVGTIMAEPVDENPSLKVQLRKLIFNFSEHDKPPYRRKTVLGKRAMISVPDARPGLSYQELRTAIRSYLGGDVFVTCKLENRREMMGYFATAKEGEQTLRQLSRFSTQDIVEGSFRSSTGGTGSPNVKPQLMYPSFVSLLHPKRKNGKNIGVKGKPRKVFIWSDEEPVDFQKLV